MGGITRVCLSVSILPRLYLFSSLLFLSLSSFSPLSPPLFLPFLQLVIGRFAVSLASVFVRCRQGEWRPGKKTGFGVTFTHVSDTYHLLHQINIASEWVCGWKVGVWVEDVWVEDVWVEGGWVCGWKVGVGGFEWMGGWMYMSMSQRVEICAHTLSILFVFLSSTYHTLPPSPRHRRC